MNSNPTVSDQTQKGSDTDSGFIARAVPAIADLGADTWTACLGEDQKNDNPFVSYAFLHALEAADCVGPTETGWLPQHIALDDETGTTVAIAPTYAKLHSRGEFVFDHAWADASHRLGHSYYPKLQVAVPFTPVPGPRLFVRSDQDKPQMQTLLASALVTLTQRIEASSAHVTFLDESTWHRLGDLGFLKRIDQQFHWPNNNYGAFEDFLAGLSSRKRKTIRKERRQARQSGVVFRTLRGDEITQTDWDTFFAFYLDTGDRKWGDPYLNRAFFTSLGETLGDACVLMLAKDGDTAIAGALHLVGGDCLYGRYWGCAQYHPFLHFELCYYQAMDFAIEHGLARVEAGAQGEHKLLRGYMPTPTYSAHWIADPKLRAAIARHLTQERRDVLRSVKMLSDFGPYKKTSEEGTNT